MNDTTETITLLKQKLKQIKDFHETKADHIYNLMQSTSTDDFNLELFRSVYLEYLKQPIEEQDIKVKLLVNNFLFNGEINDLEDDNNGKD